MNATPKRASRYIGRRRPSVHHSGLPPVWLHFSRPTGIRTVSVSAQDLLHSVSEMPFGSYAPIAQIAKVVSLSELRQVKLNHFLYKGITLMVASLRTYGII